jgi:hypothetical protein
MLVSLSFSLPKRGVHTTQGFLYLSQQVAVHITVVISNGLEFKTIVECELTYILLSSQRPSSVRGFESSVHDQYRSNAQVYDKSILRRLGSRGRSESTTPLRRFPSSTLLSAKNMSQTPSITFEQVLPLPIPTSKPSLAENSLSRWTESPAAMSPSNTYPIPEAKRHDIKSASHVADFDRSRPLARMPGSGSVVRIGDDVSSFGGSSRDDDNQKVSMDHYTDFHKAKTGLRRFNVDEYSGLSDIYSRGDTAGQKRRASSPPGDNSPKIRTMGSEDDLYWRQESISRTSPDPQCQSLSGSILLSTPGPRSSSYASTPSIGGSSIASTSSYSHVSHGSISPVPTDDNGAPYVTSLSRKPSSQRFIPRTNHGRELPGTGSLMPLTENFTYSKQSSGPKIQRGFIRECCPKNQKDFDSLRNQEYFPF